MSKNVHRADWAKINPALQGKLAEAMAPRAAAPIEGADLGDGWAAYRLVNGKAQRTPVQIGMRSALAAEVKSGLEQDQSVIIQPDERIGDGTRIQTSDTGS